MATDVDSLAVEWAALQTAPAVATSGPPAAKPLKVQFDMKKHLPVLGILVLVIGVGIFLGVRVYMQKRDRQHQDDEEAVAEAPVRRKRRVRDVPAFEREVPEPIQEEEEPPPKAPLSSDEILDNLDVSEMVVQ